MADPISIAGILVTVGQLLSSLYDYGKNVKDAREDITALSAELFALKGILEHATKQYNPLQPNQNGFPLLTGEHKDDALGILRSARECIGSLQQVLEQPRTKLKKAIQSLKWPLDKSEAMKRVDQLGRIKSTLILMFLTGTSTRTTEIHEAVLSLKSQVEDDIKARKERASKQKSAELLQWLAPVNTREHHARACQVRHSGTGSWFINGIVHSWQSGAGQRMLCLSGKSGAGKTTLFSLVVQTLQNQCHTQYSSVSAYFYCNYQDTLAQEPVMILGSIAAQFADQDPILLEKFRPLFESTRLLSGRPPIELVELERILGVYFNTLGTVYILVDAINESQYTDRMVESLSRMVGRCNSLRVLVTTTVIPLSLSLLVPLAKMVELQPTESQEDIDTLISHVLATSRNFARLGDDLKREIRQTLTIGANGSFRWVQLSLDHLGAQRTGRDVRRALKTLPDTLNTSYAGILSRIPAADRLLAREALLWLSFSSRPLKLTELCEAIALRDGESTIDDECRLHQEDAILEICRGLIESHHGIVSLAHSSVKIFLCSDWIFQSSVDYFTIQVSEVHRTLMHKCLQYLSLDEFRTGYCTDSDALNTRSQAYPLLIYAAQSWPVHAKSLAFNSWDRETIMRFLSTRHLHHGGNYASWVQVLLPEQDVHTILRTQPLYYAASFGLLSVVKLILEVDRVIDVDARGGRYNSTPLFVTCFRSHFDVARILLHAGADPDLLDGGGAGYSVKWLLGRRAQRMPDAASLLHDIQNGVFVKNGHSRGGALKGSCS